MSRADQLRVMHSYASIIHEICHGDSKLKSAHGYLVAAIDRGEREHRAFGRHLGQSLRGRSIADAVAYFTVRCIWEQMANPKKFAEMAGTRPDFVWGAIIADNPAFRAALTARLTPIGVKTFRAFAADLDYCKLIAGQ